MLISGILTIMLCTSAIAIGIYAIYRQVTMPVPFQGEGNNARVAMTTVIVMVFASMIALLTAFGSMISFEVQWMAVVLSSGLVAWSLHCLWVVRRGYFIPEDVTGSNTDPPRHSS